MYSWGTLNKFDWNFILQFMYEKNPINTTIKIEMVVCFSLPKLNWTEWKQNERENEEHEKKIMKLK